VLSEVIVKVRTTAKFQNCAEAVMVNLNCVILLYHSSIVEFFVYLIFSKSMFDVAIFDVILPLVIKVMHFTSNFSAVFQIKGLINFRVSTFSQ